MHRHGAVQVCRTQAMWLMKRWRECIYSGAARDTDKRLHREGKQQGHNSPLAESFAWLGRFSPAKYACGCRCKSERTCTVVDVPSLPNDIIHTSLFKTISNAKSWSALESWRCLTRMHMQVEFHLVSKTLLLHVLLPKHQRISETLLFRHLHLRGMWSRSSRPGALMQGTRPRSPQGGPHLHATMLNVVVIPITGQSQRRVISPWDFVWVSKICACGTDRCRRFLFGDRQGASSISIVHSNSTDAVFILLLVLLCRGSTICVQEKKKS